jgi:hypothetical protein
MSVTDLIIDPFNAGRSRTPGVTQQFIADPVTTLRQYGGNVSAESEAAWRQLSAALRALQAATRGKAGGTYQGTHALYVDIHIPI